MRGTHTGRAGAVGTITSSLYLDVEFQVFIHGEDVIEDVLCDAGNDAHLLRVVKVSLKKTRFVIKMHPGFFYSALYSDNRKIMNPIQFSSAVKKECHCSVLIQFLALYFDGAL